VLNYGNTLPLRLTAGVDDDDDYGHAGDMRFSHKLSPSRLSFILQITSQ
jgi:hypothetical protein